MVYHGSDQVHEAWLNSLASSFHISFSAIVDRESGLGDMSFSIGKQDELAFVWSAHDLCEGSRCIRGLSVAHRHRTAG